MPLKTTSFSNIQSKWHTAPPRWGHKWHSMCSYMAMFPPTIPHVFVRWLTSPGDTVYDPFCGRGTTVLEACRLGRIGLDQTRIPLLWILTSAKANPPSHSAIRLRLSQLRDIQALGDIESQPIVVRSVFDPNVLAQLVSAQCFPCCHSSRRLTDIYLLFFLESSMRMRGAMGRRRWAYHRDAKYILHGTSLCDELQNRTWPRSAKARCTEFS